MAKNVRKAALLSIIALFAVSCSIPPTYKLETSAETIENICQQEYNINISAWTIGRTIWVYLPFEKSLLDKENKFDDKVYETMRDVSSVLKRVMLSMDEPFTFYALVLCDIKNGTDIYNIGFSADIVEYQMNFISSGEFQSREVILHFPNPAAIGDTEGKHIPKYDISIGEFIAYLTRQSMEQAFLSQETSDNYEVNDLRANYENGRLSLEFDIMIRRYEKGTPVPFDEAGKIIKKFLETYADFKETRDIVEIEINDIFNRKKIVYSIRAFLKTKS